MLRMFRDESVRLVHEREMPSSRRLFEPALKAVAISADNEIYFASGLDGRIYRLRFGREQLVYEHSRQIRDIAFNDTGTLFFSSLDTPQNGRRLDDCRIYSLNERSGRLNLAYTVLQRDLKEPYWGTFAFHNYRLYISTLRGNSAGVQSSIYRIERGIPRIKYRSDDFEIHDFTFSPSGASVFFTNGTGQIFRLFEMRELSVYVNARTRQFNGLVTAR